MKFLILLAVCTVYVYGQTADYCAGNLCSSGKTHIACRNTGAFGAICASDRQVINITTYRALIVQKHNTYRNQIAGGNLGGFSEAERMATMEWDSELASLAELNVKQCALSHDACRNTDRFKYSGQNLAWRWGIPAPTAQTVIIAGIDSWFNENKDANQAYIDKFQSSPKVIGHFTGMVGDKNTRVGCACLSQSRNGGKEFFFACNYAQTNIINYPIYVKGPVASKCTHGTNPEYPALCATTEPIDPNLLYTGKLNP